MLETYQTTSSPPFFLRDSRASETRARVKITPRRVSPFLAWGDFHARSRFARSTVPEEKWGTTRSLETYMRLNILFSSRWGTYGLRDSKSAYFQNKTARYFEICRGFFEIFRKSFGIFRHFFENFGKEIQAILRDICVQAYFQPSSLNIKLQAIFPSPTRYFTETIRWVTLLDWSSQFLPW